MRPHFSEESNVPPRKASRQLLTRVLLLCENVRFYTRKSEISFAGLKTKRNIEFFSLFFPSIFGNKRKFKETFWFPFNNTFWTSKVSMIFSKSFFSGKRLMLMGRKVPFSKETTYFSKVIIEKVFHNKIFNVSG